MSSTRQFSLCLSVSLPSGPRLSHRLLSDQPGPPDCPARDALMTEAGTNPSPSLAPSPRPSIPVGCMSQGLRPRRGFPCKQDQGTGGRDTDLGSPRDSGQARKSSRRKSARGHLGTIFANRNLSAWEGEITWSAAPAEAVPTDAAAAPCGEPGLHWSGSARVGRKAGAREPSSACRAWEVVPDPGAPRADLEPCGHQRPLPPARDSPGEAGRRSAPLASRGGGAARPGMRLGARPTRAAPGGRPGATQRTSAGILRALAGEAAEAEGARACGGPGAHPSAGPLLARPFPARGH